MSLGNSRTWKGQENLQGKHHLHTHQERGISKALTWICGVKLSPQFYLLSSLSNIIHTEREREIEPKIVGRKQWKIRNLQVIQYTIYIRRKLKWRIYLMECNSNLSPEKISYWQKWSNKGNKNHTRTQGLLTFDWYCAMTIKRIINKARAQDANDPFLKIERGKYFSLLEEKLWSRGEMSDMSLEISDEDK